MKTTKVTIKNISDGPRGFNEVPSSAVPYGTTQQRVLDPGDAATTFLNDGELESVRNTAWFEITEEATNV